MNRAKGAFFDANSAPNTKGLGNGGRGRGGGHGDALLTGAVYGAACGGVSELKILKVYIITLFALPAALVRLALLQVHNRDSGELRLLLSAFGGLLLGHRFVW